MAKLDLQRIPSLDGLRAVSILLVIMGHLNGTRGFPVSRLYVGQLAKLGVDIFFAISGFLITTLLLNETAKAGSISLKNFYIRRAYRIWPAAYVYMICMMGVLAVVGKRVGTQELLLSLTYATGLANAFPGQARTWELAHMWSLSVEEIFYFIWPASLLIGFRHRKKIAWVVVAVVPILNYLSNFAHGLPHVELSFFVRADALACGCLAALYREKLRSALSGLPLLACIPFVFAVPLLWDHPLAYTAATALSHFCVAALVLHFVEHQYWLLNNQVAVWIGVLSYSIYLVQQPFLNKHASWAMWPLNVIGILAAACLLHYLVEKPMLSLREKRGVRSKPKAIAATV